MSALACMVFVSALLGDSGPAQSVAPPRGRTTRETVDFEATLQLERLRFTCDGFDVELGDLEGTKVPIALRSSVDTTIAYSPDPALAFRRTISSTSLDLGFEGFAFEPFLTGRSIEWRVDAPHAHLAAFDVEADGGWNAIQARIDAEYAPWVNVWKSARPPVLDDESCLALQRSFSVPGGLAQYAPRDPSEHSATFRALLEFLAGCFDPRNAGTKLFPAESGVRVIQLESRPDAAELLRVLWRRAWGGDHGVRDVGELRAQLEYRQRSEFSLDEAPGESGGLRLRNAGTTWLRGELEFTTKNASWPAKWTCALAIELDWKTRVDWR